MSLRKTTHDNQTSGFSGNPVPPGGPAWGPLPRFSLRHVATETWHRCLWALARSLARGSEAWVV